MNASRFRVADSHGPGCPTYGPQDRRTGHEPPSLAISRSEALNPKARSLNRTPYTLIPYATGTPDLEVLRGGSWVVISRLTSTLSQKIGIGTRLIALPITTHEPPSSPGPCTLNPIQNYHEPPSSDPD